MLDAGCENQHGFAIGGECENFLAGGLNEAVVVHQAFDFFSDEFATADVQTVRADAGFAGFGDEWTEKSVADEFADADFVTDGVEEMIGRTDVSGIEPVRSGGQPDHAEVWIDDFRVAQELAIHAFAADGDEVAFIDDDQIERSEFARSFVDTLDAGHEHGGFGVAAFETGGIDADAEFRAQATDFVGILFEEFLAMCKDEHAAVPLCDSIRRDFGNAPALAGPCGQDQHGVIVAFSEMLVNGLDRFVLVSAQHDTEPWVAGGRGVLQRRLSADADSHFSAGCDVFAFDQNAVDL